MRGLHVLERTLLILGGVMLGAWPVVRLTGIVSAHAAVAAFEAQNAVSAPSPPPTEDTAVQPSPNPVDTSQWSATRIRAYNASLGHVPGTPLAVLKIPRIRLEVPVYEGTEDLTLDRGAGWIPGSARPGELGNIGIAGHRDGFFRGLKDVVEGDEIRLALPGADAAYVVDKISVVTPENVSVLRPTPIPSITLVTCFPFYFVGNAPRRYIVSASLREISQPH